MACSTKRSSAHKWNLVNTIVTLFFIVMFKQIKILHMPQQLSCRGMCKICLDLYFSRENKTYLRMIEILAYKFFVEWFPPHGHLEYDRNLLTTVRLRMTETNNCGDIDFLPVPT